MNTSGGEQLNASQNRTPVSVSGVGCLLARVALSNRLGSDLSMSEEGMMFSGSINGMDLDLVFHKCGQCALGVTLVKSDTQNTRLLGVDDRPSDIACGNYLSPKDVE